MGGPVRLPCASNLASSAAATPKGFMSLQVESFGVGNHVKLPGPSASQPNIYPFGTPYQDIFNDLTAKSTEIYTQNGLLPMMQRNMGIKRAPERWHDDK